MTANDRYDTNFANIEHGWDVYDVNGDKVGDVKDVNADYLTVSKGFFFPTERFIPLADVRAVRDDNVYLNVDKSRLEQEGWDRPPMTPQRPSAANTETGRFAADTTGRETDQRTLELERERLVTREQRTKAGEVELGTHVESHQETVDVPVTEEQVIVEQRPVQGRPAREPIGANDKDIRVPVYEERVDVEKRPEVYEEVDVETRPVQHTERVSGTVKKEVLDVDKQGDINVVDRGQGTPTEAAEADDEVNPS